MILFGLKKNLNSVKLWISMEKVHRIIKFDQKAWLKSYIHMNRELEQLKK